MALHPQYPAVVLGANGRAVFNGSRNTDGGVNLDIILIGSLGGGAASIQASYHVTPNGATDAEWQTLAGATGLLTDTVYSISVRGRPSVCVRLTGASAPALTVLFS
jgi:hypothetical protein